MEQKRTQTMNSLWQEKFDPKPIEPFSPTAEEYGRSILWTFERDKMGNFCRAGLVLALIRLHSLDLHRRMVSRSSLIASVGLFRRHSTQVRVPERKAPRIAS